MHSRKARTLQHLKRVQRRFTALFAVLPTPIHRHSRQVLLFKDKFIGGEKSSFYFPFRGNCDLNYLVDSLYYCSLLKFTKIAPNQEFEFFWLDIWYSRVVKVTEIDKIKWQYLAIWSTHSMKSADLSWKVTAGKLESSSEFRRILILLIWQVCSQQVSGKIFCLWIFSNS